MNPISIAAQAFRCYDRLELELPDGCVAVIGENGSGKSSLIAVVDVALFGPRSRSLAEYHNESSDDDLIVELVFEHAGETYRVRRTFSPRGKGKATCDFEWCKDAPEHSGDDTGPEWTPLTRSSVKETDELICDTIGLTRATFFASSFLVQGRGGRDFTEADPAARKRVLADVLGLDRYDRLAAAARHARVEVEARHIELAGRIRLAEETLAGKPTVEHDLRECGDAIVDAADQVADLEREHTALAERYQAAREQHARRQAAAAELRTAEGEYARLTELRRRGGELSNVISDARDQLAMLPDPSDTAAMEAREATLVATVQEHQRLRVERDAIMREATERHAQRLNLLNAADLARTRSDLIRAAIAELEAKPHDEATCDRCKQVLAGNSRQVAVESMTKEANASLAEDGRLRDQAAQVEIPTVPDEPPAPPTAELEQVRGELTQVRAAAATRAQLEERIRAAHAELDGQPANLQQLLVDTAGDVEKRKRALDGLLPVDVDEITRQGVLVKNRLEQARATLGQQQQLKARLDERLAQIAQAEQQQTEAATARAALDEKISVYLALEKAFGRDGIPALILENTAIPSIETEANRILDELGTAFRVELRTQAELKSGDGLRDTLDVIVQTEHGTRPYETFSGGEKTRLNLALRIALARLLAHRRGAESRLLVIDEPDGLDEPGMAALVDVLRGLQSDFEKLYVVSHVPGLRDSFDTTLTVADGRIVDTPMAVAA